MISKSISLNFYKVMYRKEKTMSYLMFGKRISAKIYGFTMPELKLIVLNQDLSRFMLYETLAHERIHEIFCYLHIRQLDKLLDKIDIIK